MRARPWARTGQAVYGVEPKGKTGGYGGEAHCELDGEVGEAGGGLDWQESTTDDDDVQDEDGGDGECTGRPRLIRSSDWTKWTVAVLLGVFSRRGEHGGRDGVDGHGVHELERAGASRESEARCEEEGGRGRGVLGFEGESGLLSSRGIDG